MTAVHEGDKLTYFYRFVRRSQRLVHLDCSGMLKSAFQVKKLIKAVKKQPTVLALHLNDIPIISLDLKLQLFIKKKLLLDSLMAEERAFDKITDDRNFVKTECSRILDRKSTRLYSSHTII